MWVRLTKPDSFGDCLWLGTPDHPEELPFVWLVMGATPDQPNSITIPISRIELQAVVDGLKTHLPKT